MNFQRPGKPLPPVERVGSKEEREETTTKMTVLIIMDRNVDLKTMVAHTWDYQPLVHDILSMRLSKVVVDVSGLAESSFFGIFSLRIFCISSCSPKRTGRPRKKPTTLTPRTSSGASMLEFSFRRWQVGLPDFMKKKKKRRKRSWNSKFQRHRDTESVDIELNKYKEEHERATRMAGNPDGNPQ